MTLPYGTEPTFGRGVFRTEVPPAGGGVGDEVGLAVEEVGVGFPPPPPLQVPKLG